MVGVTELEPTVKETGSTVEPAEEDRVMLPLYVPAARPDGLAVTVRLAGLTALVGETESQLAATPFSPVLLAVAVNEVLVVLVTVTVCEANAPLTELRVSELGEKVRPDDVPEASTVTGTSSGESRALVAVMVMLPVFSPTREVVLICAAIIAGVVPVVELRATKLGALIVNGNPVPVESTVLVICRLVTPVAPGTMTASEDGFDWIRVPDCT